MTNDQQWAKLYKYLDKRFKLVDKRFDIVDKTFREHLNLIEGLASRIDHDDVERSAMIAQADRLKERVADLGKA